MDELLKIIATGAVGALFGWLSGAQKAREEIEKWQRTRKDTVDTSAVALIKELATNLASASHSASWLTWQAKTSPSGVTQERITLYDNEMHELFPKILGAQAALAAVSPDAAKELEVVVNRIVSLDVNIAEAAIQFMQNQSPALQKLHEETKNYHKELPKALKGASSKLMLKD